MVQGVKVERATVRTTLTPWAATARLSLGRRWSGWEPTTLTTNPPALANGAPPIPESERPRRRHVLKPRAWFSSHALRAYPLRARVGGGSAERAGGRSAGAARAGKRARRSGAQPGALMR